METKETKTASPPPKIKKAKQGISKLPTLDNLIADVKKEEVEKTKNLTPWNNEELMKVWNSYKEGSDTKSTVLAMETVKITLTEDGTLQLITPNKLGKETLKKEAPLIDLIRKTFVQKEIKFVIKDDVSLFPEYKIEEPVKETGPKEKLDSLIQKNPLISDFITRFNLKLDK